LRVETYVDTGIIVKGYVRESNSPNAIAILEQAGFPLLLSHFHEIEIPNAIRLKRFRLEISKQEEEVAIRDFLADIKAGRLIKPDYDLAQVFRRAEELSSLHSGQIGTRSLDLLHVAAALDARCSVFSSFDARQRKLAGLCGLTVLP